MPSNVTPLRTRSDAQRVTDAAEAIRGRDCIDADDLADLLAAIGAALRTVGKPPLSETEMYRWSATVHVARRVAATYGGTR